MLIEAIETHRIDGEEVMTSCSVVYTYESTRRIYDFSSTRGGIDLSVGFLLYVHGMCILTKGQLHSFTGCVYMYVCLP